MKNIKHKIASLAYNWYEGKINWEQFIDSVEEFDEVKDQEVMTLIDMIEHEPKVGGFLGVSEKEYDRYKKEILGLIEKLMD